MPSKAPPNPTATKTGMETLGTTRHEKASALLSALLLLLGVMTTGMLMAWLSATITWNRPTAPVKVADVGGGHFGDRLTGGNKDLEMPGPEEGRGVVVEEKVDPALETITSLVSTEVESLEPVDSVGRKTGPEGIGDSDGIPAWERWEIKFPSSDLDVYAQQLDFFKVELGVAGGGVDVVDYCSNFTAAKPNRRNGKPTLEKRLYFLCKSGNLREADRALARKAGIEVSDRVVFQFYTSEMYARLLRLENIRMGRRRIIDVKRTTFGLRGTPGNWEFYVLGQQYRAPLPFKS